MIVEGRGMTATTATTLADLRNMSAGNVSVVVGSDRTTSFRAGITANYANATNVHRHAAVGTILGLLSRSQVNHSIAWVERNDVQNPIQKIFLDCGLSNNNTPFTSGLDEKGYVHFYKDPDAPGTYVSGTPTCIADNLPSSFIELNRTMAKAAKQIRTALIPSVSMPVLFNEDGTLRRTVVEELKAKGNRPLNEMLKAEEISAFGLKIEPSQNILATGNLQVEYEIVPTGTARKIVGYVNFINPFNS